MLSSEIFASWIYSIQCFFFCSEISIMKKKFYSISLKTFLLYGEKRRNSLLCYFVTNLKNMRNHSWSSGVFWKYVKSAIYHKAVVNIVDILEFGSWNVDIFKYPILFSFHYQVHVTFKLKTAWSLFSFGKQDENVKRFSKHYSRKWRRVNDDDDDNDG